MLTERLTHLKDNVQHLWHHLQDRLHFSKEGDEEIHPIHIDNYHYESHRVDNLDMDAVDELDGVVYGDTENSEFSRGKTKAPARGIDSFGEDDSIDPESMH